jgi:hypothetical protein
MEDTEMGKIPGLNMITFAEIISGKLILTETKPHSIMHTEEYPSLAMYWKIRLARTGRA